MDDIAKFNKDRWEDLARNNVEFSRPFLELDEGTARAEVDTEGLLGNLHAKQVLCLAGGGGQQSAAFGILGAEVTILDISENQLERDMEVAKLYGFPIRAIQGDMRDLSMFEDTSFDVVYHAFSIDFIPDPRLVFSEVARVLRPNGLYRLQYGNPFSKGTDETTWNGQGYMIKDPYIDGSEIEFSDKEWEIYEEDGTLKRVEGPREFRHSLSGVLNTVADLGFALIHFREQTPENLNPDPGSWDHFMLFCPPWLTFWFRFLPDVLSP